MTQDEGFFEVSADWLKATGMGDGAEAKTFPVTRAWVAGNLPFVAVRLDDGREWELCAAWRGRFV